MSDAMLLIDTNAIINLYAARGKAGWDALFDSGKKVAILKLVEEELVDAVEAAIRLGARLPEDLAKQFKDWVSANPDAVRVDYTFPPYPPGDPEIHKPGGELRQSAGDKVITRFMENYDTAAVAAKQAAGIDTKTKYLLLTDDVKFIQQLRTDTGMFDSEQMSAKGLADIPYQGTPGFWATRFYKEDITKAEYLAAKASFEASGRDLSGGFNTGRHGEAKLFNLRDSWLSEDQLDQFKKSLGDKVWGFLNNQSGSVDPEVALKGGYLAGAIGLAAKFGIIGDVLSFTATVNQAAELREQGKEAEANEIWVRYIFETTGGTLGLALGRMSAALPGLAPQSIVAKIVLALSGSAVGSLVGAELGSLAYKAFPQFFDSYLDALYKITSEPDASFIEIIADEVMNRLGFMHEAIIATDGSDFMWSSQYGARSAGAGDDVLLGLFPTRLKPGDPFEPGNADGPKTTIERFLTLDGQAGADSLVVVGGEKAVTIGGNGRDWIFNTSKGGKIYGDTVDGRSPDGTDLGKRENSDNFWWWSNVTIMDAKPKDVLKFFDVPLTGGSQTIPVIEVNGGQLIP